MHASNLKQVNQQPNRMPVYRLSQDLVFPSPHLASQEGLLAVGGDLSVKRLLLAFLVFVAIGVALPFGCVGNRQFNTAPEDYLRVRTTGGGLP